MTFGFPYPPSKNALFRTIVKGKRAFPIKSAEYRAYDAAVEALWPRKAKEAFERRPLSVTVRLYRPRKVGDIDGPIAALFDVLNGRAWSDDSDVVELHVHRFDDKANPRVEVEVEPLVHISSEPVTVQVARWGG